VSESPIISVARRCYISNIWLIRNATGESFLIDTGHYSERAGVVKLLWQNNIRKRGDLTAILLTHRHSDHAGNAQWLKDKFGSPVICHAADASVLSGDVAAPTMEGGCKHIYEWILQKIENRFPARCQIDDVYKSGTWRWGFHVIEVPGHTQGSIMLYHPGWQALFSGDSLLTGAPPGRLFKKMRLARPAFSDNHKESWENIRNFLNKSPQIASIWPGHGPALNQNIAPFIQKAKHLTESW
jgi:glyoxylase-like metal-dependent hydrolase (beta-lactamase superfamily II)